MTASFSREVTLKRQGHIRGRSFTPVRPSVEGSRPLNIIIEEDEPRSSSPMSCYSVSSNPEESPNMTLKAKRRHATLVSDIILSRVFPTDDCLLSSPRPAPQPPSTSPDSFRLTFTDLSYKFPHPPIPTPTSLRKYDRDLECVSPTSSLSSSPADEMPLTPSTSDDEFGPPTRQRPVIQPLVITKHNPRPSSPFDEDCPISPSLLQPFKNASESSAPLSPLSPSYLPEAFFDETDEGEESDPDSDSEWYSNELSKIISLRSPIPPSFPHQTPARPDSLSLPSSVLPNRRRASKPLPPTPLSGGFPSAQLDPAFPTTRKRRSLPKYPPPPVPTISSSSPTPTSSSPSSSSFSRRPPPRSSIPSDCVLYDVMDLEDIKQDDSSAFSFSIYDVYLGDEPLPSPYSQEEEQVEQDPIDNVAFDMDCAMMLPLSLPTTPFDLEADIAQGLEQLRNSPVDSQRPVYVVPEIREPEPKEQPQQQQQQQQQVVDDIFSPTFTTSPTSPSSPYIVTADEKGLKSRWSTSSLGSVREEQESRGASSKLRLYFSPLKNHKQGLLKKSSTTTTTTSSSSPSPSPSRSSHHHHHKTPSSPARSVTTRAHMRGNSDVMVIGYGNNGNNGHGGGVRRRGSLSNSVSDAGSEESTSSTSSSGLRRKPIPVEMFLRSAA